MIELAMPNIGIRKEIIMEFYRKVANSDILSEIIELPNNLKNRQVEILILPYDNVSNDKTRKSKKVRGMLAKYQNKNLLIKEKDAWGNAVKYKYENN